MRSRYSAFVLHAADHLFRTWHPATRPAQVTLDPETAWTGLETVAVEAGGEDDDTGAVEFAAHYRGGVQRERSRFSRRAGRWFYVDGVATTGR